MPSSSARSAARSLSTAHRRLWQGAGAGGAAALGLLPLIYVLPAPDWQRAVLGSLALLYVGYTLYHLRTGWQAVRQLRLEGSFIGHSFNGYQLRSCLERRGHLWTHSYTVRALRRLMTRPQPNLLFTDKKHLRVRREYRRTLRRMCPSRFSIGLPLALLLLGGLLAAAQGRGGALPTVPLRLGLTSAFVMLAAEGVRVVARYRARHLFEQLVDALADWTLARRVHDLLRERQTAGYRHTPLYRAPVWFASQAPGRPPAAPGETETASSSERHPA